MYTKYGTTFVLSSISIDLYSHNYYCPCYHGDLNARGTSDVKIYGCDDDGNVIDMIYSCGSGNVQDGNTTYNALCSMFNVSVPEGAKQVKVQATGYTQSPTNGYETISRTGETGNTTATYLAMAIE